MWEGILIFSIQEILSLQETVELEPGALISAWLSATLWALHGLDVFLLKVGSRCFELHDLLGVGSFGSASLTCFKRT